MIVRGVLAQQHLVLYLVEAVTNHRAEKNHFGTEPFVRARQKRLSISQPQTEHRTLENEDSPK